MHVKPRIAAVPAWNPRRQIGSLPLVDIQEATKEYKEELALAQCTNYEPELHPETFVAYPNLKEKLLICMINSL